MRCHPMCSQRVHYSVSVALAGFSSCGSLAVLDVPLTSLAISVAVPVKLEVLRSSTVVFFAIPSRLHRRVVVRLVCLYSLVVHS